MWSTTRAYFWATPLNFMINIQKEKKLTKTAN